MLTLDGAKFRANENDRAPLLVTLHVPALDASQIAWPRHERHEGNFVLLVRLLNSGRFEIFEDRVDDAGEPADGPEGVVRAPCYKLAHMLCSLGNACACQFTNLRIIFCLEHYRVLKLQFGLMACSLVVALGLTASTRVSSAGSAPAPQLMLAQAMVPRTGMMDAEHPMPMKERMSKRFPQPVRVGDLIGLPVLDMHTSSTIGYVRQVARTPQGDIELVVSYSPWWGWFGRPVAVPVEAVGIEGRQIVSLDMSPEEYAKTKSWERTNETLLPKNATISIPLSRS